MSGLDGLQLDADGYLDMDQFPDDGTDLAGPDLDRLRDALHADPVDEPTAEQWDAMFDDVVAGGDTGPFAVDDVDGLVGDADGDGDLFATDDPDLPADEAEVDADDAPVDDDLDTTDATDDLDGLDGLDLDGADDLDPGLADVDVDGGLDLAADDGADDVFTTDALDDAPADISHDFEDLL